MRIIIELQTNDGVSSMVPARAYENNNEGEAAFYTAVAAAAVSSVKEHSVALLDRSLTVIELKTFYH